uniref:Integrase, catalytic region, zinc finger, CCHC-type, peptidase aspartic, catalytic n=1 Tax=Tanacetum cinerariifolium TaxID=118510 RepID=A0A6L2K309_TANCI|nr:integrase, catalytic region, zinc finger, CCHC-type, peptidase aspartic, catalytic [Tanacetum cinerariifolium]
MVPKTNVSKGLSKPDTTQNFRQTATQAIRNINVIKPGMYRIDSTTTKTRAPQLPQTYRNNIPRMSTFIGVTHKTNISRPQLRSTQVKDKVVPNNRQMKDKKTEVEDHPMIASISNNTKYVTACNDGLKSRTSNVNDVCATCGKYLVDSYHFACVTKMLNDVNARTKKPNVVPISTRKPKGHANKSVATPPKKTVASESTTQKSKSYYRMLDLQGNDLLNGNCRSELYIISLQETTSSTPIYLMVKASPTQAWLWHRRLSHLNFDYINLLSKKDVVIGLPKLKYVKDQLCSSCEVSNAKRSSFKTKAVPSSKERLNLLHMDLCGPMRVASTNRKKYTLPVQTRRQLATNPEMCMFALTVSNAEPKNIKEAMANSAWIEAMQEKLHQFDRLQVWKLIDKPFGKNVIRLKWLWKNKKDEDQTVIRNKARLVAKGYA